MAATADTGVRFGIENHGNTTNDPEFLAALFDGVGSKRLGLTLDTGNFYWFGHPLSKLYGLYEQFAPRAFHTHCKSIRYPEDDRERQRPMGWKYGEYNGPIYDGDIDFGRVVAHPEEGRLHRRPVRRERIAQEAQARRSGRNAPQGSRAAEEAPRVNSLWEANPFADCCRRQLRCRWIGDGVASYNGSRRGTEKRRYGASVTAVMKTGHW